MSDRLKHRLNNQASQTSVNRDARVNINLSQSNRLFPSGDMNRILDVGEQFNKERQASSSYRLIFSITSLFTNVLTDITGTDSLSTYQTSSSNNKLVETNGWVGYAKSAEITSDPCKIIDLNPKRELFDLSPKTNVKNWDIFVTIPVSADSSHYLVNGGLVIIGTGIGIVGGKSLLSLSTPVKHNLTQGSVVRINNVDYSVVRLGEDNGDNKEYTFIIDTPSTNTSIGLNSRMKKVQGGQESEYYFRIFSAITNNYEIYPIAFSKNIFLDKTHQVVINEDIDVSKYTDNLGRPLSELYLTILKKNNNNFSNVDSGVEMPLLGNLVSFLDAGDVRRIHNVGTWDVDSHVPIETNLISSNSLFYGDVVEYNKFRVEETILGEVHHRFNRTNRVSNGRPEGYYYKPHHQVKIRDFSTFIEQGDDSTIGIPDYAEDLGDGRYLWRDLLDIGINDGQDEMLDYPFLNGSHYRYENIILNLRRQDPFNEIGLYYINSPRDLFGDRLDDNNFITNSGQDVC
jgi:hypothetical protein